MPSAISILFKALHFLLNVSHNCVCGKFFNNKFFGKSSQASGACTSKNIPAVAHSCSFRYRSQLSQNSIRSRSISHRREACMFSFLKIIYKKENVNYVTRENTVEIKLNKIK